VVCVLMILAVVRYFAPITWPVVAGTTLLIPFTRMVIASTALHWNRHR
jgi:hypothetical protein